MTLPKAQENAEELVAVDVELRDLKRQLALTNEEIYRREQRRELLTSALLKTVGINIPMKVYQVKDNVVIVENLPATVVVRPIETNPT